ncbi:MAG: hypothetical protein CVU84_01935 [Firmicutes bacterium HGW-Firmicutes-1]|jgi:hypothetical protein|nr:MAG: hypothetical protein CVU84_01935 [Firmicutes bacterium HGW-Firmicutes-1]
MSSFKRKKHNYCNRFFVIGIICFLFINRPTISIVQANGGPVDGNGLIEGGNIEFIGVDDISIIEENLDIVITRDYVDVNVEYILSNEGQEREVDYIFPILIWLEEHGNGSAFIDNISMKDGDSELEYSIIETEIDNDETGKRFNDDYGSAKIQNLYSQLFFNEKEMKKLIISYRTKGMFLDWGISNTFFLHDLSDNYFSYDLSPASNWGDGQADSFFLTVDYSDLLQAEGNIINTNLTNFEVNNFDGIYTYKEKDYDFKKHSMIEIEYSNKIYREKNYMQKTRLEQDAFKEVKVSSTLVALGDYSYQNTNLFDNNLDSCWSEGVKGVGIGETIELTFDQGIYLTGVALVNGNIRNEETYTNNNRIKELKIEFIDDLGQVTSVKDILFEDISYNNIDKDHIYNNMKVILDYGDGRKVERENTIIRLTILDVYAGKKYDDTCISEILAYGYYSNENDNFTDVNNLASDFVEGEDLKDSLSDSNEIDKLRTMNEYLVDYQKSQDELANSYSSVDKKLTVESNEYLLLVIGLIVILIVIIVRVKKQYDKTNG